MSPDGKLRIKRITEVGVAVKDLDKATRMFVELLGGTIGPIIEMPLYSMRYCMCRVGKVDFELMEPLGGEGVIANFLRTRGEGLHHIGFAIEGLDKGMKYLESRGVKFVGEPLQDHQGTCVDFAGRKVLGDVSFVFSVPSSTLGILFEFIQYPEGYQTP